MAADYADEKFVKEDANDANIIIIGAGLAGLTCAYYILEKKAGLDVLIIEENEEAGGRVLPKDFSELYHANFLQEHVTDLIETFHVNINQEEMINSRKRILYTKHGTLGNLPKFYGAEVHSFLRMIDEQALTIFSAHNNENEREEFAETSLEQLLRKFVYFPFARSLCRAFICSVCATRDLNDVSSYWFLILLNGALGLFNRLKIAIGDNNRYFIRGGPIKIVNELLKNILQLRGKIIYSESVNEINYNNDQVYVITNRTSFRCELVVIAVPPPMHNRIIIEPPLEHLSNNEIFFTPSKNIFFKAVYNHPIWRNSVTDVTSTWDSNSNLNVIYNVVFGDSNEFKVAGFVAEPDFAQNSRKGLFETLNECFGSEEASEYLEYKECNYFLDDGVKGGSPMSVMMPSFIGNCVNRMGVAFGRVFFASSEYATTWPGTIDGSIEVGKITAYSILNKIRPQTLSFRETIALKAWTRKPEEPAPFRICVIQYLGLVLNIAVFLSFYKCRICSG